MGLDTVDLVLEVEHRFGVQLRDAECSEVRTVADLAALVIGKLPRRAEPCPTASTFYELRQRLLSNPTVQLQRIGPRTRLTEVFPRGLRSTWRQLRKHEPRVPRLVVSPGLDRMLLWVMGVAFFASVLVVSVAWARMGTGVGVVAVVAAVLVMSIVIRLPEAIGWRLPQEVETVGDLVRIIAPLDWPRGGAGARLLMQHRVLEEVREITSRELGVPLEKVKPESEFVKDLGAG
jgi:acyl carrier protein